MIEIIDNKVYYINKEYSILEIEEFVVHLIDESGYGVCVNITEDEKNNLIQLMNQ